MEQQLSAIEKLRRPNQGGFSAFAMIVDINSSEYMVETGSLVAQFTRDVLSGGIKAAEAAGGDVVAIMGDGFLAIFADAASTALACFGIAKDLDDQCKYIHSVQSSDPDAWDFAPGGPGLKISVEFGYMDESTISSEFLGQQTILAGRAIIHADRITRAGEGNRCLIGPDAAKRWGYPLDGPYEITGKRDGSRYVYYKFDLGDIWREGDIPRGEERHWG
jgi:class 3 adenylate cyclase